MKRMYELCTRCEHFCEAMCDVDRKDFLLCKKFRGNRGYIVRNCLYCENDCKYYSFVDADVRCVSRKVKYWWIL